MRRLAIIAAFLACAAALAPARAENLVLSLSTHRVAVTSSFVGADLVLFGTVEPDAPRAALRSNYDLVATVIGPRATLRTRRKARVLGIWVNVDTREFIRVPSYLAVLSNRPVPEITNTETARRLQLGLNQITLTQRIGADFA
ncbi:MAG TPA: TIGR02186 family protein, partial [Pseudolabrys sp.]|nr:TIGR02186 family protein [Pseudolabrys sp.]